MKKVGLLLVVLGLLVAAPLALASSSPKPKGTACHGAKYSGLHVHGISCRAALKYYQAGGGKLFKCKATGKRVPYLVICTDRKHHSTYYDYAFQGG